MSTHNGKRLQGLHIALEEVFKWCSGHGVKEGLAVVVTVLHQVDEQAQALCAQYSHTFTYAHRQAPITSHHGTQDQISQAPRDQG